MPARIRSFRVGVSVAASFTLALALAPTLPLHGQSSYTEVRVSPQDTSLNLDAMNYSSGTLSGKFLWTYTWPDYRAANAILMKLDMPALPAGAVIHEAKLHLRLVASDRKPGTVYAISAHKVVGKNPVIDRATGYTPDGQAAWTPNACCHNSVPMAQGDLSPAYDTQAIDKSPGFKAWTITSMVEEWMADPATNRGLVLNSDTLVARDRFRYFASMEHVDPSFRPFLAIRYSAGPIDTTPPSVSVTSPANATELSGNVLVSAQATDDVGVVGVQLRLNGSPLGPELTAPPYSGTWDTTTASDGIYTFAAVARDSAGNTATSPVITATVANGVIRVQPRDTSLNLSAVNYSSHANLWSYTWPDYQPANAILMKFDMPALPSGARVDEATLHLALVESDATADASYAMAAHKVVGRMPDVTRATGYTADGQIAWTPNGCCSNGIPMGQGDLSPAYDTRSVDKSAGFKTWAIAAMVREWLADPSSNGGIVINPDLSAPRDRFRFFASMEHSDAALRPFLEIRYSIDQTPPSISITAPTAGSTVAGTINITASATDNAGIAGVQFKVDGVNLGAEDTAPPYALGWNSTTVANGAHAFTAIARDDAGNITSSASVAVNVANDLTPPSVALTAPAGGVVAGVINVAALASDNIGVAGVQFKLNGVNLGAEDTTLPHAVSWSTTTVANGVHSLSAVARDDAGNITSSASVAVNVANDQTPPSVAITAPAAGATLTGSVTITAAASDNIGVAGVQFLVNGANLGIEDTAPPYAISWSTTSVPNGSHTLTAKARDAAGNSTSSASVAANVANDQTPPSVAITAPAAGATLTGSVTIAAAASDNVGVAGVQFLVNGANLGIEDTAPPYAISWSTTSVPNGSHTLTAKARDAAGNSTSSASVAVNVANDQTPPSVAITAPAAGATLTGSVTIAAAASDNVGVAGVQFLVNGANLGIEDTAPPYAISWSTTSVPNGSHTLTAKARDAAGNQTTSSAVAVTVANGVPPPPPPPSGAWPNEPAGYTALSDQPWNALSSLGWNHQNRSASSFVMSDATAPLSSSNVLAHSYPAGMPGGVEPAVDWLSLPASFTEGYVAMWWKPSNPWQGHSSGVNKIFFIFGNAGHIVPVMYGTGNGAYELRVAPEWGNWSWLTPNVNTGNVTLGQWHRIEIYFKQQTSGGVIKWWMDGNLIGSYTNVAFPSNMAFQEVQIAPTWGGVGGTKSQQDYFWFDHVRISRPGAPSSGDVLFQEAFEDASLAGRGWYDNTSPLLSTSEHVAGSARSIEYRFTQGATMPTTGSALRRKFTPSDSVYLSYYVKYSTSWVGSQRPYHPHEFHFLTTLDADWSGLSNTHLTTYIEQNGGTPLVAIQDGLNVDQSRIGVDLTSVTENRGVAGCNGTSDGYPDNCYLAGSSYTNEKKFPAASRYFTDTPGPFYKNDWHFVEVYIKLNTVSAGRGVNDGIIQYWFDGQPVINRQNVLFRTGANPTQKFNQLVIAPYIGDGSPVAQSMWFDNLTVATARP